MNKLKKLIIPAFFILIVFITLRQCVRENILKQAFFIEYGTIYETGRGKDGASLYYRVKINNSDYYDVESYGNSYASRDYFLNKILPVAISKKDTSIKKLLIKKSEFAEFGLERPGSLDWIGED